MYPMLFGYINIKMVLFLDKNKGYGMKKRREDKGKMKQTREKKNFLVLGLVAVIVSAMLLASMPTASAKL